MTAKKTTEKKETTTKTSHSTSFSGFMNILAFVAVCIGGVALFLAMILRAFGLTANWIGKMQMVANAIGWLALVLLSVNYIKRRKKLWIWIVWIVAVVMIFIGIIIPLFS